MLKSQFFVFKMVAYTVAIMVTPLQREQLSKLIILLTFPPATAVTTPSQRS
jgi:hypothetical protein